MLNVPLPWLEWSILLGVNDVDIFKHLICQIMCNLTFIAAAGFVLFVESLQSLWDDVPCQNW